MGTIDNLLFIGVPCLVLLATLFYILRKRDPAQPRPNVLPAVGGNLNSNIVTGNVNIPQSNTVDINAFSTTISLDKVVDVRNPDHLSMLKNLGLMGIVYVMMDVSPTTVGEEGLATTKAALHGIIPQHRVLAFTTEIGKFAIVRQIRPKLHIEWDMMFCSRAAPHVPKLICIQTPLEGIVAPTGPSNVTTATGFENIINSLQ